ncbi:ABC transporter six-transmembrane domain-containing protein [Campylobacter sp. CCUG 57310]|uniref:ABC transporter six-transmembrane domain-containing protein n=1 Tax=Campylobacter sp. CCUG 57310 TaxID=2517362 RepID=UPI00156644B2|nr:ABC transporter six-transmembrane domain-containing protein [Campylobacter sp. CCUG 57310]QKF92749.1 ABC transporter, ATP-binding/permease components [Campylobacter sp. CCUG 57310]
MKNSAFKTLKLIAKQNFKKLFLAFSLVLAENGLFLIYPLLAGIAINAIIEGKVLLALTYSLMVFIGWGIGAARRRIDTQVFTKIYADLAVKVIMNEKAESKDDSVIIARANLSREFVDFFEQHFPMLFTSAVSIFGSVVMLFFIEFYVGLATFIVIVIFAILLPRYISKNDKLYLRLNNQIEKEVSRIKEARENKLKRHYNLLSLLRVRISNREAMSFLIIGISAAVLFGLAIITLANDKATAGHIYSVITYLWTFAISLDDAPNLIEQFSKLKDIGKRVNTQI